jgi:hypothetical protein
MALHARVLGAVSTGAAPLRIVLARAGRPEDEIKEMPGHEATHLVVLMTIFAPFDTFSLGRCELSGRSDYCCCAATGSRRAMTFPFWNRAVSRGTLTP